MSGLSTPTGGKQEKAMSSRLLTMKFMQRAAASASSQSTPYSSPSPNTGSARGFVESPAKRQKVSPQTPYSPASIASTPGTQWQPDGTIAPSWEGGPSAYSNYPENPAETKWILDGPRAPEDESPSTAGSHIGQDEDPSPPIVSSGRRTFGDFKKRSADKEDNAIDSALSSDPEGEDQHGYWSNRGTPQNGHRSRDKRHGEAGRQNAGTFNFKRSKVHGISATAGRRPPSSHKDYSRGS